MLQTFELELLMELLILGLPWFLQNNVCLYSELERQQLCESKLTRLI